MDELDLGNTIKGFIPGQKVLNRYKLGRILGRGGMGVVWLAHDEELERDVALKFLPEIVALDPEAVGDLKRETRRNLDLTHAHIVRIYDFVSDGRTAAISMEYVDGATLSALKIEQPGRVLPVEQLRPWLQQLTEALHYAHAKAKVVHRDLKPANFMVNRHGDLKITDFGIARGISDSVSRVSKQAGTSGTPVYMSPQQMMGEDPAVSDDIYALGATLFELLTGKPPFHSGNIVAQVQGKPAPLVNERRAAAGLPPIPTAWEQVIAACLEKDPALRPRTAGEVFARLSGDAPGPAVAAKAASAATAGIGKSTVSPEPATPPGKTESALATLLAVTLAGCGLVPVWLLLTLRSHRLGLPDGLPAVVQMLAVMFWMLAASVVGQRLVNGSWRIGRALRIAAVLGFTHVLHVGFQQAGLYPAEAFYNPEGIVEPFAVLPSAVLGLGVALLGWGRAGGASRAAIRGLTGLACGAAAAIGLILLPKHLTGGLGAPDLILPLAGLALIWWRQSTAAGSRPVAWRSPWLHAAVALLAAASATALPMADWHRGYYYVPGVREAVQWRECVLFLLWCTAAFGLGALGFAGNGWARSRWIPAGAATAVLGLCFRTQWRAMDAGLLGGGPTMDDTGAPTLNDPGNIVLFFFGPAAFLLVFLLTRATLAGWKERLGVLSVGVIGAVAAWASGWMPGGISSEAAESAPTWFALLAIGFTVYAATLMAAAIRHRKTTAQEQNE